MNKLTQKGFTLIELMIVVAIIGILAAIAIPAYNNYTKKARFSEVVASVASIKTAVEQCINDLGSASTCDTQSANTSTAATYGITAVSTSNTSKYVNSVAVNAGTITATTKNNGGLGSRFYEISPTYTTGSQITWSLNTGTTSTYASGYSGCYSDLCQ